MAEKTLEDLFLDTVKDIYFAERQILKALPKMARAAQSPDLKAAFENTGTRQRSMWSVCRMSLNCSASRRAARPVRRSRHHRGRRGNHGGIQRLVRA